MLKMKMFNENDIYVNPAAVLAVADATGGRSDVIFTGYQVRVNGAPAAVAADVAAALAPAPAPEEPPVT
jgi:hypothetical protein